MAGSRTVARRAANAIVAIVAVLVASNAYFQLVGHPISADDRWDPLYLGVMALAAAFYLWIGRLIVSRQPSNTVGWILLTIPLLAVFAMENGAYLNHAYTIDPGSLPFRVGFAWLDRLILVPTLTIFIPIFLLFPDGRLPSPRWKPIGYLAFGAPILTTIAFAVTPGPLSGFMARLGGHHVENPLGVTALAGSIDVITQIGGFACLFAAIASFASLVVRYRGATADTRQQIRWLALVGGAFLVELATGVFLSSQIGEAASNVIFIALFITIVVGIPAACGIAILKYHLYDLDVVIRKAVIFAVLAAFIAAVYAAIVGGVGALVGSSSNTVLAFAAAAFLAIAFQPVRERARRLADRLVYGKRATPYEVLADFSDRMAETYATEDVLPRMAEILRDGAGAVSATVWLRIGPGLRPVATAGEASPRGTMELHGDDLPAIEGEDAVEVRHQGELLGALSLRLPPSDPMNPAKGKLVRDLASQAGLVLRNVRLISELRASRQRLVAAQDEERRKLERNLHDGAQQQLVALAVKLRLAEQLADRDAEKSREMLVALQTDTQDALENLRDLARGIYPPLLADKGLSAALEGQARKASIPVEISTDGAGRYPQDTEAAVYFCCLEALQNVQKYANATMAQVRLSQTDGRLTFEVSDDGTGFDPSSTGYGTGLQGMADRLDAIGGTLQVRSAPGAGTTVTGTIAASTSETR